MVMEKTMVLAGPFWLWLSFHVFVGAVGVLILSGTVNTAMIGSNGVLSRVAEDACFHRGSASCIPGTARPTTSLVSSWGFGWLATTLMLFLIAFVNLFTKKDATTSTGSLRSSSLPLFTYSERRDAQQQAENLIKVNPDPSDPFLRNRS